MENITGLFNQLTENHKELAAEVIESLILLQRFQDFLDRILAEAHDRDNTREWEDS